MKICFPLVTVCSAMLLAGCGKSESTSSTSTAASAPATTPAPAAAAAAGAIEITGNDTMQFSKTTLEAKAGVDFKVKFTNAGTMPKTAMGHNWVLLKPGTDIAAFATAGQTLPNSDYIAPAMQDKVVAHTKVLGPKESEEVSIKGLPAGDYPYVCTFPGHFALMKGVLTVK